MKTKSLLCLLASLFLLQGCAGLVAVGAASTVSAVHDRRSIGSQIDDQNVEFRVAVALSKNEDLREYTHINAISYNGVLLVVGQSPNDHLKNLAETTIAEVEGVEKVHNLIRIGSPTALTTRANDAWITSRVKTQLLASEEVDGMRIKVYTEDSEVFLLGLVTDAEAEKATEIARNVRGVARVVKVFEFI